MKNPWGADRCSSRFFHPNQPELLAPAQVLDLPLPPHGGLLCFKHLMIDQGDRPAGAGVFGASAGVVGGQTLFQVVGPACVECAVGAAEDIGIVLCHGFPLLPLNTPGGMVHLDRVRGA